MIPLHPDNDDFIWILIYKISKWMVAFVVVYLSNISINKKGLADISKELPRISDYVVDEYCW